MKRPIYCFIDDSPFEIALFEEVFSKEIPEIEFICAASFNKCKMILDERSIYPSLFILDLYGKDELNTKVDIPAEAGLEAIISEFISLEDVYQDLNEFSGDLKVNEFLKRLFTIVNDWRDLFTDVCQAVGQGRQYGIGNLQQAMNFYPMTGIVFYTRKAVFPDAIALNRLGCYDISNKPMGRNDDEIRLKTKEQLNDLITQWNEVVRKKHQNIFEELLIKSVTGNERQTGINSDLVKILSILQNVNKEVKTDFKSELWRILNNQTSVFSNPDIPDAFVDEFITWNSFYYNLNG